ncbi:MAG: 4-vinyl reductase [Anaerosporomusa subterranea]|jgi:predicted hydrocarbon binding protein|nr:4-vinyl reductase [Anaerosporomusa subterranea]
MYKFKSDNQSEAFSWESLGDIAVGRANLGSDMPVIVYRLFQFTLRDVLNREYGCEQASNLLRAAGKLAGTEFCKNILDKNLDFNSFVAQLQKKLAELRIGILRLESADMEKLEFVLTVEEDLDCSGLPITEESVCDYDEGFIAGILNEYTGKHFTAKEIDCWATGDRTCRFQVTCDD